MQDKLHNMNMYECSILNMRLIGYKIEKYQIFTDIFLDYGK